MKKLGSLPAIVLSIFEADGIVINTTIAIARPGLLALLAFAVNPAHATSPLGLYPDLRP